MSLGKTFSKRAIFMALDMDFRIILLRNKSYRLRFWNWNRKAPANRTLRYLRLRNKSYRLRFWNRLAKYSGNIKPIVFSCAISHTACGFETHRRISMHHPSFQYCCAISHTACGFETSYCSLSGPSAYCWGCCAISHTACGFETSYCHSRICLLYKFLSCAISHTACGFETNNTALGFPSCSPVPVAQ